MNTRLVCLLPLLGSLAAAQSTPSPLKLTLSHSLVTTVTENGKPVERIKPSTGATLNALPGAVILQTLTVVNTGKTTLPTATVRLPVPKNTTYGGALQGVPGVTPQFSFDNGKTYGPAPLKRRVTVTENGRSVTREVEVKPSEYTDVRWTLGPIAPGQTLKLSYRITVQ